MPDPRTTYEIGVIDEDSCASVGISGISRLTRYSGALYFAGGHH